MSKFKFLIGLTGSIACYKTCTIISRLRQDGHDVQIIATPSALKFVGEATLEGLSGRPILSQSFTSGHMMDHITLARWADIFLIAPLTANHANKLAHGLGDDLLTTIFLAYEQDKPLYLAPAMNSVMYKHPTVQESLKKLNTHGAHILPPGAGRLACGEDGYGKMMEPEDILKQIYPTPKGHLLITFGGTREPIDGVRFITNLSTGETGANLSDALAQKGFNMTCLSAVSAHRPRHVQNLSHFSDHNDLDQKMQDLLQSTSFDAVIHLAAVSDFSVDRILSDKMDHSPSPDIKIKSDQNISLVLKPNTKIVNNIKKYSKNPNIKVIAFKLTNTKEKSDQLESINKLLKSPGVDYVVHNDLNDIYKTSHRHPFALYKQSGFSSFIDNISFLANAITQEVSHDSMP